MSIANAHKQHDPPSPKTAIRIALVLQALLAAFGNAALGSGPSPPSIEFKDLYRAVELQQVFPDQKTFADAIAEQSPAQIMAQYRVQKSKTGFNLRAFVLQHFHLPSQRSVLCQPVHSQGVESYIAKNWTILERWPDEKEPYSSLLPLKYPSVVPGGRFSEIYYWDSYFTMVGLEKDGRHDLARDMLKNFASLIDRYGHVPNGNRTYYLSRSQPPFFSCMIELIAAHDGRSSFLTYLPQLQAEYDYWMDGASSLAPGRAYRHVVELSDGTVLNRYWDDRTAPRDESYLEDFETAKHANRPRPRSIAIFAPVRKRAGILVLAGSKTQGISGRFKQRKLRRSTSTA